jgi:HAD superfamily hydrolase (TIGR01549 family)
MLDAVVFDYGDTLFRFRYEQRTHELAAQALLDALAADGDPQEVVEVFWVQFDAAVAARVEHQELDYEELMATVLAGAGIEIDRPALREALRAEHDAWRGARELHADSIALLEALRAEGLRIGMVSNAFDPADLMHEDLRRHGIDGLLDAVVFSSEIGVRKPHPRIYETVLERLGTEPERALFVGDRVLEDVQGPAALGMATCLVTYYREDEGDHSLADFRASEPMQVLQAARSLLQTRG